MVARAEKPVRGFAEDAAKFDGKRAGPDRPSVRPGRPHRHPAVFRKAMQVKEGDRLMARVVDGELRLITPEMGIRKAQKMVRESIPDGPSLVDTLMENRRREVEDEFGDG